MVDLTTLTEETNPASSDIAYVVTSPATTKNPRFSTWANILKIYDAITAVLTGKTINFADNTITGTAAEFDAACSDDNFVYTSDGVVISGGALGTPSSGTLTNCTGLPVAGLVAVTASRALVSDGSGKPSAATTTATEIGYVNGVTSSIQTQLDAKVPTGGALGTPSSGTLTNCTGLPTGGVASTLDAKTLTAVVRIENAITAITPASTIDLDFSTNEVRTLANGATAALTITTSNKAAGRVKTLIIQNGSTAITSFPSLPAWVFLGAAAPTGLAANKTGVFTLICTGTTDASIVAAYSAQV